MGKYFQEAEFKCPDCGQLVLSDKLIPILDIVRGLYGKPMYVTSGYRCPTHNAEVGGKPNSAHVIGEAADISCVSDFDRYKMIDAALSAGINRIGISSRFLHLDISRSLPQFVIWVYSE